MSHNYRAIVTYHFKKGMEEKAIQFLEKELIQKAKELGGHYLELWQNEKSPSIVEGIGIWTNLEDAKAFQSKWEKWEKELVSKYCERAPEREFCKLRGSYSEKIMKAA